MSSLHDILNPENKFKEHSRPDSEKPPSNSGSPSSVTNAENLVEEKEQHVVEEVSSKQHKPHPDCPDTLSCLPDTDGRPQHTLPVILRCAILGSPKRRLTIRDIYSAMEEKYPYYKTAGPTWKQSVRHHLSLNRLFERQPRPVTDPGFGSYWTVNLDAPPGTKRPRKRGRSNKELPADSKTALTKRRGRPRKAADRQSSQPPITTLQRSSRHCQVSAVRTSEEQSAEEDEDKMDEDGDGEEGDYESEEDMVYPFQSRTSTSSKVEDFVGHSQPGSSKKHGSLSLPKYWTGDTKQTIDRLQIEVAGLKRQSADAISASLRVSDQLAQAQAEASRAKAALNSLESMLEDESKKRREAERLADEETRRRRAAEEALKLAQSKGAATDQGLS